MPVDGYGEGGADGGFFQKKRIKGIRYQQVIHKIFHGCNLNAIIKASYSVIVSCVPVS